MPAYNASQTVALYPGDEKALFNAENVTNGESSIAIARTSLPQAGTKNITFAVQFASSATCTVNVMGAMTDVLANYYQLTQLVFTAATGPLTYTDAGSSAFYLFQIASGSGTGCTAIVHA
jgi:hypothetical protein